MRTYTHIQNGKTVTYLPATSNRIADAIPGWHRDQPDGWYRSSATFYARRWLVTIGRAIDPRAEAIRLRALAERIRYRRASTGMPGVSGYQQRADAATAAIQTQAQINVFFADLLDDNRYRTGEKR